MLGGGAVLLATACGGGGGEEDGEITLVLDTFGVMGYDALIEQYEEEHPNITIEERNVTDLANYTPQLQQNIAAGSGAGDVVAIEEANIAQFLAQPDQFVDLNDHGGAELEDNFLGWKWEQGHAADGQLIGLGTDIGSMGMCYNVPLFEDAGLPTEPDEVSELWPTWEDFISTGEEFTEADTGASFVSTIQPYFRSVVAQQGGEPFQNREGDLVVEQSDTTREAFDTVTAMADAGLSASLPIWSEEWNAGIQNNAFATLPCPAWMLGHIESTAGEEGEGQWNVADVPGEGGNWGGSFLAVPAQSEHPEEAAELAKFLTSPEGQLSAWEEANVLPSSPEALESAEVTGFTRPYFNDAPVGEIYSATALELEPVYFGPDMQAIDDAFRQALESVEQGQAEPDEGWDNAVEESQRATGER
ncbi:extracellular solute-binding protein [Streptomonospora nanhaiensis]|uniref:Cellobiose transport system substrate-binding protein n=1 Tax=Streptomonospora nanhaiensis TaxID=1323731 RepID=A0A853BWC6_9ACTN|nr:extracellular solute-binding protein [Streptomonospora nanhaiensis]MBV2364837.1 extracellular solute-binding protein [Streptomonospora nanhaiensis]MBX9387195.1 extracellular solute-binding protein [Streptomonospora nanhaiensis]NYI98781.1 cellobiose transport system substrate-binding protein [Streptomonospora nanhaiensis]